MITNRAQQIQDFLAQNGHDGAQLQPLTGDASFRHYIRILSKGNSLMLMDAPPEKEDVRPYLAIAGFLSGHGYSAPMVHARDAEAGLLLLEDLGDHLYSALLNADAGSEAMLYEAAIDLLAEWHDGAKPLTADSGLTLPYYNNALLLRELQLFADWYLPQVAGGDAVALGDAFMQLWRSALADAQLAQTVFVHRDYHADNLLWLPERHGHARVGLLDFQDGVYGDPAYDMASLLEDARRDVPPALAAALCARYLDATGADAARFRANYALLAAQRNCKIIGIFARLSTRDGKPGYLRHLPRVWRYLEHDVSHPALAPLQGWLEQFIPRHWRGALPAAA